MSSINELALALGKAQGELTNPPKDKIANVPTKNGGKYTYAYADIATIIDHIRPALSKHGLSITQPMKFDGGALFLETTLMHSSGQFISSVCPLPVGTSAQELGSWLTYMRRYALCGLLGIAADEDRDANEDADINPKKKVAEAEASAAPEKKATFKGVHVPDPLDHVIAGGALKDQKLGDVLDRDGLPKTQDYINRLEAMCEGEGKPLFHWAAHMKVALGRHLERTSRMRQTVADMQHAARANDREAQQEGLARRGVK